MAENQTSGNSNQEAAQKNIFQKIGWGVSTGAIRVVFFLWGVLNRILYVPKVTYDSPEVKKLLKDRPCILIANHTSHNDGSFIPQVLGGRKIWVLITAKWYDKPKLNWMFRRLRYIRINLTEMDNSWMEIARQKIEAGYSVLIFPEGKLGKDGVIGEFLPGFLMLARHTDAPVVPMTIRGGYRKFHRESVRVGSPVDFDVHKKGRPSQILKEGADVCRTRIVEMMAEEEAREAGR